MNYVNMAAKMMLEGALFMIAFIILIVAIDIFRTARQGRRNLRESIDKKKNSE